MKEVGFSKINATHGGGRAAAKLYDYYGHDQGNLDMDGVDQLIAPMVRIVTGLAAPLSLDTPITAIK